MHGMHGVLLRSAGLKVIAVYISLERTPVKAAALIFISSLNVGAQTAGFRAR